MSEPLPEVTPEVLDRVVETTDAPTATNDSTPVVEPATPEGAEPEGQATDAVESFTKFDPNALSDELKQVYTSMQGDYTRKTQEVAPWRQLAEELGTTDPTVISQAMQLFTHLQDESNLRSFTERLASELGIAGQPSAATDIPNAGVDDLDLDSAIPEHLQQKIEALEARLNEASERDQHERFMMAAAGEVARQEAYLAEAHPEWKQEDWNAVYELAPAFDGSLIDTANALEAFATSRLATYVNGKSSVADTPGFQPAPVRTAETVHEVDGEDDPMLRGAAGEAKEYLRNLFSQSE